MQTRIKKLLVLLLSLCLLFSGCAGIEATKNTADCAENRSDGICKRDSSGIRKQSSCDIFSGSDPCLCG